jgi:hypothetical protein
MRRLKAVIASSQHELKSHPLFEALATAPSTEPIAAMARALVWWPMVFQDVLRLNLDRLRGSGFERFAEFHQSEDAGHDRWYLEDLGTFGLERPGLEELFGESFQPARETCYALVAEVLREQSGAQRLALLLALEPTGHVFFERISAAVDRVCPDLPLRYFGRSHLTVEKDHDLFAESTNIELERIVLTDIERARCEEMVGRIFGSFHGLFSYLAATMKATVVPATSYVRGLAPAAVRNASGA